MKKTASTTFIQILLLSFMLIPFIATAQLDQWRGPERNGIYPEKNLLDAWPENGPELLLTVEGIGTGWSSAVTNDKAIFITGMKDTLDYLTSIDNSGKINWQVPYGRSWNQAFQDTRCTPTIEGNRIYVISGTGRLGCFDATNGKEIWGVDVDKQFETKYGAFGLSESPLIVDNKVICTPIGKKAAIVAFDKNNGKLIWQSKSIVGQRGLASPILYHYKNFRYILSQSSDDVFATNPDNGEIVWTFKFYKKELEKDMGGNTSPNTPIFKDNEIFITKGYDYPAYMLQLASDGKSVSEKWMNRTLDCHHGGVVLIDGFIYGSNWVNNSKGNWVCLKWDTGEVMYETSWINKGSIISADNKLFCYEEKSGNVGLVKPNPQKFEVISSFKVGKGTGMYWAHPMIKNGKLFIRHGTFLLVYNIKK